MSKPTKEELVQLIEIENLAYTVIAKQFSVSDVSIRKWAIEMGINIPDRSKKSIEIINCPSCGKEFKPVSNGKRGHTQSCSSQCAANLRVQKHYEEYLLDNSKADKQKNMQHYKKHFLIEQNNECAICGGKNIWNDKELIFVLDHIDGNADNNYRNNLRLVCPNCDSQLDTFKSKNKDSARAKYRKV